MPDTLKQITPPPTMATAFRADVLAGLAKPQKTIPAKYFYDAAGSALFDQICELPEYYPTRTEFSILRQSAPCMAKACGPEVLLIELGAGSLTKVRTLLTHLEKPAGFVAVDVSEEHLKSAAKELRLDFPELRIRTLAADFTQPFPLPNIAAKKRVVYFPGSTLGNFEPREAAQLLRQIAVLVGPGGGLLLGIDLRKDTATLEAAYNDRAGITAAFNKNLLVRLNRELGANFDLNKFKHHAPYNAAKSRIEMHLISTTTQTVTLAGHKIHFAAGETIHTENSHKYDLEELAMNAEQQGLTYVQRWTDPQRAFAIVYFTAKV